MFEIIDSEISVGKCPFCGTQSFKYKDTARWMFLCYGCQRNVPFEKVEPRLEKTETHKVSINFNSILTYCTKVSELPDEHLCKKYVRSRKIPENKFDTLFFTEQMDKIAPLAGKKMKGGSPKLVLPFFDEEGKLFGLQVRALDNEQPRYLTLMFDEKQKKIFGLDNLETNQPITVVEGPIDSLFLKNSLAMAGTDGVPDKYKTLVTICLDNEPRNKQVVKKMAEYLDDGYTIVIWPERIKQKDINDMITSGIDVESVIVENKFSGIAGKVKLNTWKKI